MGQDTFTKKLNSLNELNKYVEDGSATFFNKNEKVKIEDKKDVIHTIKKDDNNEDRNLNAHLRRKNREKSLKTKEDVNVLINGLIKHQSEKKTFLGKEFDKKVDDFGVEATKNIDKKIEDSIKNANYEFDKKIVYIDKDERDRLHERVNFDEKTLKNLNSLIENGMIESNHINIKRTEASLKENRKKLKDVEKRIKLNGDSISEQEKIKIKESQNLSQREKFSNWEKDQDSLSSPNELDRQIKQEQLEKTIEDHTKKLKDDVFSNKRNIDYFIRKDGKNHENVTKEEYKLKNNESKLNDFQNWEESSEEDSYFEREKKEKITSNVKDVLEKIQFAMGESEEKEYTKEEKLDLKKSLFGFKNLFNRKNKEKIRNTLLKEKPNRQTKEEIVSFEKSEKMYEELNEIEKMQLLIKDLLEKVEIVKKENEIIDNLNKDKELK